MPFEETIVWTSEMIECLGSISDSDFSRKFGISRKSVWRKRESLNIPIFEYKYNHHYIENGIEYKKCSLCFEYLTLDNFGKHSKRWDGVISYCKKCFTEYKKQRLLNNDDARIKYINS